MVAPLAELSWGLGRLGGGEARGFRFAHVEGEEAGGGPRGTDCERGETRGETSRAVFKSLFSDLAVWP